MIKNKNQIINSEELNISFNFVIKNYQNRILDIETANILQKANENENFNQSFFDWFMEDLIFFLDKNRYQKRWDYGLIRLYGIKNLKLNDEQRKRFGYLLNSVTNFDLIIASEDNYDETK